MFDVGLSDKATREPPEVKTMADDRMEVVGWRKLNRGTETAPSGPALKLEPVFDCGGGIPVKPTARRARWPGLRRAWKAMIL